VVDIPIRSGRKCPRTTNKILTVYTDLYVMLNTNKILTVHTALYVLMTTTTRTTGDDAKILIQWFAILHCLGVRHHPTCLPGEFLCDSGGGVEKN
jgi:hypothetical protein